MECPRFHGEMSPIELSPTIENSRLAWFCEECHGVWMRESDYRGLVNTDFGLDMSVLSYPAMDLMCPHCSERFKYLEWDGWRLYVCRRCQAVYFDADVLPMFMARSMDEDKKTTNHSPLEHLCMKCDDCGAKIEQLSELSPSPIGCSCKKCASSAPVLSESKQLEVQIVTFHDMEVKIDRFQSSSRCRISVTPAVPGKLNVSMHTLSRWERFRRMGWRCMALRGELRKYLDASEDIASCTPWHVFLAQRGTIECLEQLVELGKLRFTFKPHNLIFEIEGDRLGAETRLKFEAAVRRLLIVYERFVSTIERCYDA